MAARPDYADALFNLALLLTRASSTYPPSKRGKTDAADAEAVAEAVNPEPLYPQELRAREVPRLCLRAITAGLLGVA